MCVSWRESMKRISGAHWDWASLTRSHLPSLWSAAVVTRPLEIQTKEKETHLFELVCISAAQWVLVTDRRDTDTTNQAGFRTRKWKVYQRWAEKQGGSEALSLQECWRYGYVQSFSPNPIPAERWRCSPAPQWFPVSYSNRIKV